MDESSVILFHSNNYVMWAAKLFKKESLMHKITSIPRELSSDCGYCIQINTEDEERAEQILKEDGVEFDRICPV